MTAPAAVDAGHAPDAVEQPDPDGPYLAVVGMAGRFPGARTVAEYWTNLLKGQESITRFPGAAPDTPEYTPALGLLDGAEEFDAAFFGYPPREALILDPQQRLFLQCAWEALEAAGYDAKACEGAIGVYAGSSQTSYLDTLLAHRASLGPVSEWQLRLATGIDFLTSRVAHKLGLTGPAITVQTACSTSLVAIHVAAQALLAGECDLALAGGASVNVPLRFGEYAEGGVISPDGHCRAFDARARGTVGANGVGIVVLKRLAEALADGDHIHAVVRGTAVNNDGPDKVGFTAPGVTGQSEVIRAAHLVAEVDPATIGYVEAHGTATPLGDPIELGALTAAFRHGTDRRGFCRIGSVKTNIGHTDAAAGVAGFIKAVLTVEHGLIPASLHWTEPNPEIPFAESPFVVNAELYDWRPTGHPRRAGVSSFGIGGTNAHVVVEQPPTRARAQQAPRPELLVLSARTAPALAASAARLAEHLQHSGERPLADAAWTLQTGRRAFEHRRFAVAGDHREAVEQLLDPTGPAGRPAGDPQVAFVFPGQGGQHIGMGRELYEQEPVFRARVDECCALLAGVLGRDLRDVLHPVGEQQTAAAREALRDMGIAQPAVFVVEYALAELWQHWGIRPTAVAGHSLGAFVAACVAGVMTLPEALLLVAERGRLLGTLPAGAMLAVPLAESAVDRILSELPDLAVELAAVNGPEQCVLSGPAPAVGRLQERLGADGVDARLLHIAAAGHCAVVEPILAEFAEALARVEFRPPTLPWVGDTTGGWVPVDRAPTVAYWTAHMREAVRFSDTLTTLLAEPTRILLEVGPGRTLTGLARRHPALAEGQSAVPSLPHPADGETALRTALAAAGRLWAAGAPLSWEALRGSREPWRTPLPTYPFSRDRHSPLPGGASAVPGGPQGEVTVGAADGGGAEVAEAADGAGRRAPGGGSREERLARLFARVLGLAEVGPQDHFFELGGDSLIAVQLVSAVRAEFGVRVTVKELFGAPTPARLARLLTAEQA
ncbi:type I polyketide synthase [Kitasatospora sp. NPDC093550]|uniref:type I polyketide synthase n=1 Tax=Kitasatospora sp. NPDC093550 TaxID=3364089 RepID=UPI00382A2405